MATPLGNLIDQLWELREDRRKLAAQDDALKKEFENLEKEIMDRLLSEELPGARGKKGVVSYQEVELPHVVDWDEFWEFIYQNRYFHMMERRPSVPGCRELFEQGKVIPGVEKFVKQKLALKSGD